MDLNPLAPCARLAACACLLVVFAWPMPLGAEQPDPAMRGHGGPIRSIAVLDGRTVVTGGFDTAIVVWDVTTGAARRVHRLHDAAVTALAALGGGCFASGGEDGRIAVTCDGERAKQAQWQAHAAAVTTIVPLSAREPALTSGSFDRTARRWPADADPAVAALGPPVAEHNAPVNGVALVADGVATAAYDGEVRVTGEGNRVLRKLQLPAAANGLAALPDGRLVVTASDGRVRVLTGDLALDFEVVLEDGPLTSIAVSRDGAHIAVAGMRTPVTIIDVGRRKVARQILGPGLPVWALAFSPDGAELFTGGADRALRRWTVATGLAAGEALSKPTDTLAQKDGAGEDGARVFRACVACHTVKADEGHRAGPTLAGIMGRPIATAPGYQFSDALRAMRIVWTQETIAKLFEVGPAVYTPGTKMPEQRITDPADRQALVEWLARVTKP